MTDLNTTPPHEPWNRAKRPEGEGRQAVAFGIAAALFTLALFFVAWASSGGTREVFLILAPIVAAVGAAGAAFRTYQMWRQQGRWKVWQLTTWLLIAAFIVALVVALAALL